LTADVTVGEAEGRVMTRPLSVITPPGKRV
jgi:hypothetical protein